MAGRKECSISVQGVKIKQWGVTHTENDESVDTGGSITAPLCLSHIHEDASRLLPNACTDADTASDEPHA